MEAQSQQGAADLHSRVLCSFLARSPMGCLLLSSICSYHCHLLPLPLLHFLIFFSFSVTWLAQLEILGLIVCNIQMSGRMQESLPGTGPWWDRAVHHCTPAAGSLLRYDCIGCVPKALSRREAQRRGCSRVAPGCLWITVSWPLWFQRRWESSSYST